MLTRWQRLGIFAASLNRCASADALGAIRATLSVVAVSASVTVAADLAGARASVFRKRVQLGELSRPVSKRRGPVCLQADITDIGLAAATAGVSTNDDCPARCQSVVRATRARSSMAKNGPALSRGERVAGVGLRKRPAAVDLLRPAVIRTRPVAR